MHCEKLFKYSCVVLNNYEDIKDAFSQAVFNGLPDLPAINLLRGVMEGVDLLNLFPFPIIECLIRIIVFI